MGGGGVERERDFGLSKAILTPVDDLFHLTRLLNQPFLPKASRIIIFMP